MFMSNKHSAKTCCRKPLWSKVRIIQSAKYEYLIHIGVFIICLQLAKFGLIYLVIYSFVSIFVMVSIGLSKGDSPCHVQYGPKIKCLEPLC